MSEIFYWAVVKAVLLFGAEIWVLLTVMYRKLEGVHVGFLGQVRGQKSKRERAGNWRSAAESRVLKEAGTQTMGTYIEKWQVTVVEWVLLRSILKIFNIITGYQ